MGSGLRGIITYSMAEEEPKKPVKTGLVIREYTKAALKYPWLLAVLFGGALFVELGFVIGPLYIRTFIDTLAVAEPSAAVVQSLLGILGILSVIYLLRWAFQRAQNFALIAIEAKTNLDLLYSAFSYLLRHSYGFFVSNFAGSLTRRVNRYSHAFQAILESTLYNFFSTFVFATGVIIVLMRESVLLGAVLLLWTVVFIWVQVAMAKWRQPLRLLKSEEDTKLAGAVSDSVTNQTTVTLFAGNAHEHSLIEKAAMRWYRAATRSWRTDEWIYGIQALFAIAIEIGLLAGAVILWSRGLFTVGDLVIIQVYVLGLISRVWNISGVMRRLYEAFADASEMVAILHTPHAVADKPGAKNLQVTSGTIEFDSVEFGFNDDQQVAKGLSFTIPGGQKVGLVGPSGAGKSTITKLVLRFYDVTAGSIRIDGQNIMDVTQDSLHEAIGFVPQEPILFHRSLMENIRYGKQSATDEEVMEAAKKAHCHDFIMGFPEKYDTPVGERGVKLSGGERQRVAIARAILKNAPILILDEATSALDSESEALIQDALKVLMEGKTVIVFAHRLSTIMTMDRIVVIESGAIAAEGTHDELVAHQGGLYQKLWSIQAGGFIVDDKKGA